MKYRPEFPGRFGCKEDAHVFCTGFFIWYNIRSNQTPCARKGASPCALVMGGRDCYAGRRCFPIAVKSVTDSLNGDDESV
jgi:hypothetical protein